MHYFSKSAEQGPGGALEAGISLQGIEKCPDPVRAIPLGLTGEKLFPIRGSSPQNSMGCKAGQESLEALPEELHQRGCMWGSG